MKAIIFDGELKFVSDHPIPEPGHGEALVRVRLAGICNTDLEITKGYKGFHGVLGHEFVGIVEKTAGNNNRQILGKRVVGEITCGCGNCQYCRAGLKRHCPARTTIGIAGKDGSLAEHVTLPVENLFVVPSQVKDEEAVFAEPLAAAYEILEQIHMKPTDAVLVMGDGKLGILVAIVLRDSLARVVLTGKHRDKLNIAQGLGVPTIALEDLMREKTFDIIVDATGSTGGLVKALQLVKPRGTIILKTTTSEKVTMDLSPVVVNEIQVLGSRCGPFEPALRALSEKRIRVGPLISGIYGFSRAAEAFVKAQEKGSLKVLIDFSK
jgi:threonine dehydrogenase-like Zn-dependent dehydrogenase